MNRPQIYFPDGVNPERYCCRSIQNVKQKCLRLHGQDENKCIEFIQGHKQCRVIKKQYEDWVRNNGLINGVCSNAIDNKS